MMLQSLIFMALRCKVMENTRKTEGAWGKSFSGPPRGPEEQRTYEQRTRLHALPLVGLHDHDAILMHDLLLSLSPLLLLPTAYCRSEDREPEVAAVVRVL